MKNHEITVGYISHSNPFTDKKDWSGTTYKIREAIEQSNCKIIWVPYKKEPISVIIIKILLKIYSKLVRKNLLADHIKIIGKLQSLTLDKSRCEECDYLFFSGQSHVLVSLKTKKPIIYCSDATFHLMIDYYWHNLASWNIRQGNDIERTALEKSEIIIHSSEWASNSAINFYGALKEKCHVLEFGANFADDDITSTEPYTGGELRILFSGVEWKRKGAEVAIETVDYLNKNNIKAKLFLVGPVTIPKEYEKNPFVEHVGFLNKNIPEQYNKYISIIQQSHLLLLPTEAECSPIIFSEASAYGLPIFTYDTGGLGNYVINGCNGYRLSLSERGEAFARKIKECIDNGEFLKLKNGCLQLYKVKLNWKAWASRFSKLIRQR
jgi:glycosyltransferase involved in cell wall biosynthesis